MENRINQIMTTEDGKKYMILHQAIYNNKNYYVCCGVDAETDDLNEDFYLFEEVKKDNEYTVNLVKDENLAKFIFKHLNLMEDEN